MRRIEPELVSYIDKRISWDGLAQYHLQTKNARGLMVEAAKACVGIKERTGRNDGRLVELIQKTVDGKAQGEAWCFPGFIEILTEVGWQRFDKLDKNAKVAQVSDALEISYTKPLAYIEKEYNGEGFEVKNRSIDLYCDKGHRFYGKWNNAQKNTLKTLDMCTTSLQVPIAKVRRVGSSLSDRDLLFLAAFISDGYRSKTRQGNPRIRIQVSKSRKIEILEALDYTGRYTANKVYGISKKPLTTFTFKTPEYFSLVFNDYKSMTWDFINSLSSTQAKLFLEYYSMFDGSKIKDNGFKIFTSRKESFDQLCVLAIHAGFIINCTNRTSRLSGKKNYILTVNSLKKTRTIKKSNVSKIDINETLYCVSVPEEKIIIRDRSGNSLIVGNCMAFVQSMIAYAEAKTGVRSPLMATEHCLTLWNGTPIEQKVRISPLAGAIAIWRHGATTNGHTGIVLDCDESVFFAVEGNGSGSFTPLLDSGAQAVIEREGNAVVYTKRSRTTNGEMKLLGFIKPF